MALSSLGFRTSLPMASSPLDPPRPRRTSPDSEAGPMADDGAPRRPKTLVLGVLGGIASGKSTVAEALAGPEGLVLSADRAAHEVLESLEVQDRLVHRFGPKIVGADGKTNRAALADVVFRDLEARKVLESWIHPAVRARLLKGLEDARARGVPRVVLDVPLLLEHAEQHGLVDHCDHLVFVDVPLDVRDRRAVESRGWKSGEVARREKVQLPLSRKRDRADIIIQNDGDRDSLIEAVRDVLARL